MKRIMWMVLAGLLFFECGSEPIYAADFAKKIVSNERQITVLEDSLGDTISLNEMVSKEEPLEDIASGEVNDISWKIDGNGHLTISGTGDWCMNPSSYGYGHNNTPPWHSNAANIKSASVNLSNVKVLDSFFWDCLNMETVDLSALDTSETVSMYNMFNGCVSLKTISLTNFNTSKVKEMDFMFRGCASLKTIDVSGFDTASVQNMSYMFAGTGVTSLDLKNFDTSSVTQMTAMFQDCKNMTSVDVSSFNTSKVMKCGSLFHNCTSLTKLDLGHFKLPDSNAGEMYRGCTSLSDLTLPQTITRLYNYDFQNCKNLKQLKIPKTITTIPLFRIVFNGCSEDILLLVYEGSYAEEYAKSNNLNYKVIDASENLAGFDLRRDGYSFSNSRRSFDYSYIYYKLPYERFSEVYGKSFTKTIYKKKVREWNGSCLGMSISALLFYKGLLKLGDYGIEGNTNQAGEIYTTLISRESYVKATKNTELVKLIENYQAWNESAEFYQICDTAYEYYFKDCEKRAKSFEDIVNNIKNDHETYLVLLGREDKKIEHAMVIDSSDNSVTDMGNSWYKIRVYDPNNPFYENQENKKLYPCYADATNRYIELNVSSGEWIFRNFLTNADETDVSDAQSTPDNTSRLLLLSIDTVPTSLDGNMHFGPTDGAINVQWEWSAEKDFSRLELTDTETKKKFWIIENGVTTYIDYKNFKEDWTSCNVAEEDGNVFNKVLREGNYEINMLNGSMSITDSHGFVSISSENPVALKVTSSRNIDIQALDEATVNVYMEEIENRDEYSAIDTSIEVGPDTSSIILSDGKLSIDTPNAQELDITFDVDGKETVVENVSTDTITDIDLEKPNPFCTDSHKLTEIAEVEATCTTPGTKAYFQCERCKLYFEDKDAKTQIEDFDTWVVLPAKGHTEEEIPAIAATISANGKTAGMKCSVCEEVLEKPVTVYKASKISLSKTSYTYDGKVKNPTVTVKDSKGTALLETDYTVKVPTGRKTPGEYVYKIKLKGRYTGTVEKKIVIKPQKLVASQVKLSKTEYTYDAKEHKPSVVVKNADGTKLKSDKDYKVTYSKDRKKVGLYKVTVKGIGNYSGTVTKTYVINPKATALKSVTPEAKAFTATWKKVTEQVDGYEIEYALDKKFANNAKKVTVTKNTTVSQKVKSLKSKKTYYVRIRTYKKVGKKKYYSDWSRVLSVKTK